MTVANVATLALVAALGASTAARASGTLPGDPPLAPPAPEPLPPPSIAEPAPEQPQPDAAAEPLGPTAVLTGQLQEFGSGLPLVDATVTVGDRQVWTDARGRFRIEVPAGAVHVALSSADHKDAAFDETIGENEALDVSYRLERFSWSEEVVVYGEAREEIARQVITVDELRRVPGTFGDPIRALQSLPSVARGTELSGDIIARGAEARNTAAYIDGIRIPFLFHFLVGRSVVDPGQLEDIEFYPGAVPPAYGDVSQAVINARTRFDEADPGVHGRAHVDLLELGLSGSANLGDDWTLRIGGRRAWIGAIVNAGAWTVRQYQGLNDPSYRPASLRVPYQDLLGRLVRNHGDDRVALTLLTARDGIELIPERYDLDGDGHHDPPEPTGLPYDPNELVDSRFVRVQVRWDRTIDRHKYASWLTIGRDVQQNLVEGLGVIGSPGVQFARLDVGWFSAGHTADHELSDLFELKLGADVVLQPGSLTAVYELPSPDATTRALRLWAGPFAELAITPGHLRLAPGVRVSVHQLLDGPVVVPEPRLGMRYALDERWSVVAYGGMLSQGPTLETAGVGFADGDLAVLKAAQSTVGVEARWPNGLGLDLAAYETEMWDLVVRDVRRIVAPPVGGTSNSPYDQTGQLQELPYYDAVRGRAYGLEAQLRIMPRGLQFGWLAGSIGRSLRYPTEGEPYRANADIPANLVAVWGSGLGKGWSISGRAQVSSGLVFTPLIGSYRPDYDFWDEYEGDTNADRYPLYKRFDLRIDKTWTGRRARWTWYFDVYNAFNFRNPLFAEYDWDYQELQTLAFIPMLPTFGLEVAY